MEDRGETRRAERRALASHGFAAVSKETWFVERVVVPDTLWERGTECHPLIVLLSWAEQDVERDQEGGKLPVVFMWGSWGRPKEPGCGPLWHPSPHHSRRHWGLGEFLVSPGLSIKTVYPIGRDALPMSSAWGRRSGTLLSPSLSWSGTERDQRVGEQLTLSPLRNPNIPRVCLV